MKQKSLIFLLTLFTFSTLGISEPLPADVTRHTMKVPGSDKTVWIYEPLESKLTEIPCILIAPAGSDLTTGMRLSEGDIAEHLPYVKAGFAVIAYDVSGNLSTNPSESDIKDSVGDFVKSKGGVVDAVTALKTAASKFDFIDTKKIYVAGHSSAANIAIAIAQSSPSIKGCLAYAPIPELQQALVPRLPELLKAMPRFMDFISEVSPSGNVGKIKCPMMLFYAFDDEIVSPASIQNYGKELKMASKRVSIISANTGGHYDSMIGEGLSKGVDWIASIESGNLPPIADITKNGVKGKTLQLEAPYPMRVRDTRVDRDSYSFWWRNDERYVSEFSLHILKADVEWSEVEPIANSFKSRHDKTRKGAGQSGTYSEVKPSTVQKGPFRGYQYFHSEKTDKGFTRVNTFYILWDKRRVWMGQFAGPLSEQATFESVLEKAKLNSEELEN